MNTSVTINCSVLAWLLWALAGLCALSEWTLAASPTVLIAAVLFVGGAATLHVRSFVADLAECNTQREIEAFELGRESVRSIR